MAHMVQVQVLAHLVVLTCARDFGKRCRLDIDCTLQDPNLRYVATGRKKLIL